MLSHSSGISFKSNSKLHEFAGPPFYPKKFVVGLCGNIDICMDILTFFHDPANWKPPKQMKSQEFVVLTADHKMFTFSDPRQWLPVKSPFYAIGSGSHFAMGAMEAGKSPKDAVKAAIKQDKGSGYGVTSVDFP